MATILIARSSRSFVFLGRPDPPRRYTLPSVIHVANTEQLPYRPTEASEKQVGRIDIGRHLGRSDMVVARCWQTVDHRRHPVPSRETIRRRLTEVGLRSRRPLRRLPLTSHHRQCRLFCRPRATWSVTDGDVIFSDESRFSLSMMTTAHVSIGAPASGPIRHLLSSGIQQFHKV
ncbi:HTH_Tnp_Tc3_2 domain-containing protein [Trichonephila clavipes]|uniref:HTH_Tnp_Tc3_2 domain-containing protein n=1 Tax=Trichonephila clavipes TaxID=2585209 RepID=A0A8X6VYI5_TRICX|nr:HTH_Tnp_Tc3_2 domain-containing protein [Trichonephila clavipes]